MITIYEYSRHPPYWVARDEDGYWLVPARNGGWSERTPYVGHTAALRPVADRGGIDLGNPEEGEPAA